MPPCVFCQKEVPLRDKNNFCDYFVFEPHLRIQTENKEAAKVKLEALFKKK